MTYDACASEAIKDLLHIESHSITVAQKQLCEQAPPPCEELMLYGMTVDDGDASADAALEVHATDDATVVPPLPPTRASLKPRHITCLDAQLSDELEIPLEVMASSLAPSGDGHMVMVDGAANFGLFRPELAALGKTVSAPPVQVTGVWAKSIDLINEHSDVTLSFAGSRGENIVISLRGGISANTRRNVAAESALWDHHGISVLKEPWMLARTPHGDIPLIRINGLYFIHGVVERGVSISEASVATTRQLGQLDMARLWAARMHVNGPGQRDLQKTSLRTGFDVVNQTMADAASEDTYIKRSNMRRKAAFTTPEEGKALAPGERFVLDCFGPVSAPSVVDGGKFELEGVCEVSGFGYESSFTTHPTERWIEFVRHIIAAEAKLNHTVLVFRVDRAPELDNAKFLICCRSGGPWPGG